MSRLSFKFLILIIFFGLSWNVKLYAAPDEVTILVKQTTERMLATLKARRVEVDRNPALIYSMVEDIAVPYFDFERITQGAIGQFWRSANPDQQKKLINGFKQLLTRTYARALLSYSGQEIRYLPVKPSSRPGMVTVSTEVRGAGAAPIPIDYRIYQVNGAWKAYDVLVDQVSLVGNYRSSFAAEIQQNGIDGLIKRLNEMNKKGSQ